ncbi:MAG: sodium:proton antiporter [Burkholderiales bacterium]
MNHDTEIGIHIAGIGALAILCQWLGWRLKLPAIVFLLIAGLLAGPFTGWLRPDELFGDLLFPIISLLVAVILFEGSLTLRLSEIRGIEKVVLRLVTWGTLVSWVIATLATIWLVGTSWQVATLFGAVMVVTGPTVIAPMLRTVRPTTKIANILRWEGILIDPIGAILAILTYQFITALSSEIVLLQTFLTLGKMVLAGIAIGVAAGYLFGLAIRRNWVPEFLHNFTALGLVFGVYVLSNAVEHETGLLAVTVMGLWLANMPDVHTEDILDFKESLSILFISGLFIVLAARIDFTLFQQLGWSALGIFLVLQFLARPLKIFLTTLGSNLNWRECTLLAWIGPRGIVAAAISAIFGLRLEQAGFADAAYLVPLSFSVIIGTVLLQGASAGILARWLGVAEPEPRGFLVVGANRVARSIALQLRKVGYRTLLADTSWENIEQARSEGFDTYYGSLVSEHADRHLDLIGLGGLLGLSAHNALNNLAVMRYRREFGDHATYALHASRERVPENLRIAPAQATHELFGKEVSYSQLNKILNEGAVTTIALGEDETLDTFLEANPDAIALFAVGPKGNVQPYTSATRPAATHGWKIIAISPAFAKDAEEESTSPEERQPK